MTGSAHAAFAIGAISILGGSYAYVKKKSVASLVGSAAIGG